MKIVIEKQEDGFYDVTAEDKGKVCRKYITEDELNIVHDITNILVEERLENAK